ncbi:histone-like nucleoid-structuring protein Lsr2 [Auritidibacter ignavus]|uniref:histone-like nucleoid-structuring protein Lsr2 n=1 Tax=Auritidibacter ignavus TaxID=678932 RepID=UPI001CB75C25|nr:Lsr2 family protein [Auritidibacter ignavus]
MISYTQHMAKQTVYQITDDIDGRVLSEDESETIKYSIDGRQYEIDLGADNAAKFREVLKPYISVSRKVTGPGRSRQSRSKGQKPGRGHNIPAVRTWARENGFTVPDRGRIPYAVLDPYEAAH